MTPNFATGACEMVWGLPPETPEEILAAAAAASADPAMAAADTAAARPLSMGTQDLECFSDCGVLMAAAAARGTSPGGGSWRSGPGENGSGGSGGAIGESAAVAAVAVKAHGKTAVSRVRKGEAGGACRLLPTVPESSFL